MQIHCQWIKGDLASDCIRRNRTVTVLVQARRTAWLDGLIVKKVKLKGHTLGYLKTRIQRVGGVGSVSQTTAGAAQRPRAFTLNAEGQTIGGVRAGTSLKPKDAVERPNIHWICTEDTCSL